MKLFEKKPVSLLKTATTLALCAGLSLDAMAVRDRPHIDQTLGYNVILSDINTTLRGVSLSFDGGDPYGSIDPVMPSLESLIKLREEYGFNIVHLYLEGDAGQNPDPVGVNLALADELVALTRQADLYLMITIANNGENGAIHSMEKTLDFWSLYGARYKDETHVIYEAHNEPASSTLSNWTQQDWDNQLIMYNHIRSVAPDTMILLGSFMSFFGGDQAIAGANQLAANGVTWDNAGFSFHGYWNLPDIEKTIEPFLASTDYPALISTEFWPGDTENGYNEAFETYHIGWQQFQWLNANDLDLDNFKNKLNVAGTVWKPEYAGATWPSLGTVTLPPVAQPIGIYSRGQNGYWSLSGSNLVATTASYSAADGERFYVEDLGDGYIAIKADNGFYVSANGDDTPMTAAATTVGNAERWEFIQFESGDFTIRPWGGGGHLPGVAGRGKDAGKLVANGSDASLNGPATLHFVTAPSAAPDAPQPPAPPAAGPFTGTPISVPTTGLVPAADFNHGGEGVAYHDVDDENWGGAYRFDVGVDIEANSEGTNIGWFDPSEWLLYTVDVAQAGTYTVTMRIGSAADNGSFHIEMDGTDVSGTVTTPNTGAWNTWRDISFELNLQAGVQDLKIFSNGGFNVVGFSIAEGSAPPPADATSMYVGTVSTGTVGAGRGQKYASASVTVLDNNGNPVSGVTVSGNFSGSIIEGGLSATTNGSGVATLQTTGTAGGTVSVEFCVTSLSGSLNFDTNSSAGLCPGA